MTDGAAVDDPKRSVLEGSGPMPLDLALAVHGQAVDRALRTRPDGPSRSAVFAQVLFGDGPSEPLIPRVLLLRRALGQAPSSEPMASAAAHHFTQQTPARQVALWHGFVEGDVDATDALALADLRAEAATASGDGTVADAQLRAALLRGLLGDQASSAFEVSLRERARAVARPPRSGHPTERIGWWLVALGVVVNLLGLVLTAAVILAG